MVMDKLLKVKETVVRHPIFVIGSAVWMLADMALDIVSVLGYHALSEEVWWIIKVNLLIQNVSNCFNFIPRKLLFATLLPP